MACRRVSFTVAICCFAALSACQQSKQQLPANPEPATKAAASSNARSNVAAAPSAANSGQPLPSAATHAPTIPEHNRADLAEPPPRPPIGNAEAKAQQLFDAIRLDKPDLAAEFFFRREAFLLVKAIRNPGQYWDKLKQRYEDDIHALHKSTRDLDKAEFESLEIVKRGGWVRRHQEGNALPYWASRHSSLHYRVGEQHRKLEVRVLITWDDQWWITHLSEFH